MKLLLSRSNTYIVAVSLILIINQLLQFNQPIFTYSTLRRFPYFFPYYNLDPRSAYAQTIYMSYSRYVVKETDDFNASLFPEIGADIAIIRKEMHKHSHHLDPGILISFVKYHSIKIESANANPEIAKMISSKMLPVENMESLFSSSKNILVFQKHLEEYIIACFKSSTIVR